MEEIAEILKKPRFQKIIGSYADKIYYSQIKYLFISIVLIVFTELIFAQIVIAFIVLTPILIGLNIWLYIKKLRKRFFKREVEEKIKWSKTEESRALFINRVNLLFHFGLIIDILRGFGTSFFVFLTITICQTFTFVVVRFIWPRYYKWEGGMKYTFYLFMLAVVFIPIGLGFLMVITPTVQGFQFIDIWTSPLTPQLFFFNLGVYLISFGLGVLVLVFIYDRLYRDLNNPKKLFYILDVSSNYLVYYYSKSISLITLNFWTIILTILPVIIPKWWKDKKETRVHEEMEQAGKDQKDFIQKFKDVIKKEEMYAICTFCDAKIKDELDVCPYCGNILNDKSKKDEYD